MAGTTARYTQCEHMISCQSDQMLSVKPMPVKSFVGKNLYFALNLAKKSEPVVRSGELRTKRLSRIEGEA